MSTLARSTCARTGLGLLLRPRLSVPLSYAPGSRRQLRLRASAKAAPVVLGRRSNSTVQPPNVPASSVTAKPAIDHPTTPTTPKAAGVAVSNAAGAAPTAPVVPHVDPPSWVDRFPRAMQPYMRLLRLDKPIGTILLYWPGAWAITMASTQIAAPPSTPAWYMFLFGVGAIIMRGAGCVVNDMWDVKMDRMVERTKSRPLAAGDITQTQALAFLASQMTLGLGILTQLNWYSIVLGACSVPLIIIYPLMKRYTYYPQIVLGLCFDWGALLGWAAVAGTVNWAVAAPLYVGSVMWCVGYDTIYAHQDKTDDVLAGVKSTALAWGDKTKPIVGSLYTGFVSCLAIAGHAMGAGPIYYAVSCLGTAAHLAWQVITVDLDSRADCWAKFKANGFVAGTLVWLGIAGNYVQQVVLPMMGM